MYIKNKNVSTLILKELKSTWYFHQYIIYKLDFTFF